MSAFAYSKPMQQNQLQIPNKASPKKNKKIRYPIVKNKRDLHYSNLECLVVAG
jgi:hypothetical protein